jgi:hypothetical protein
MKIQAARAFSAFLPGASQEKKFEPFRARSWLASSVLPGIGLPAP